MANNKMNFPCGGVFGLDDHFFVEDGVLHLKIGGGDGNLTPATDVVLGGVIVGDGLNFENNGRIKVDPIYLTKIEANDSNIKLNNTEILKVIKGDYIRNTTDNLIKLTKSDSGVVIDETKLETAIANVLKQTHNTLTGINGSDCHPMSSITDLAKVFSGEKEISNIKILGEEYDLKDFMNLVQATTGLNMIYVRKVGVNGDGSLFTPYGSLTDAISSLSVTKNTIHILECSTHAFPANANLTNLQAFVANLSETTGDINLVKNDSSFLVWKHTGNITVTGNNISIIVENELKGNLNVVGTNCSVFVNIWNNLTHTVSDETKIADGSKLGKYTYGYVARR